MLEENSVYTVTLADGTELSGLTLNGNNFISQEEIDASVFDDNLSIVTISDGTNTIECTNMSLVQCKQYGVEWWFILRELSSSELAKIKMESDIEYIAMMADIEL